MLEVVIIITLAVLLVVIGSVEAQTWITANQATIGWDASTTLTSGAAVPPADLVKYQAWTKRGADAPVKVGSEITALQTTITFSAEGRYLMGVQAIRYPAGETVGQPSTITWSDSTDVVAVPSRFGIVYFLATRNPGNFRAP